VNTGKRRPRDSKAAKAAIVTAARERFAAEGYDRATIRSIAADAAIDPALVMRYYGSKEGLFAAAAEFDLHLPDAAGLPRGRAGVALVDHFITRWEVDGSLQALLRTAVTNPVAAARMREVFAGQVAPAIAALCRDRNAAAIRAGLISSQLLGLALCRYILELPPVVGMSREALLTLVGPVIQKYLEGAGPAPSRTGSRAAKKDRLVRK
jgi:AcrR family transcriptional regulator